MTSSAASTAVSPINKANVAKTCGKCHVGIEETYNKSVHGQLLAKGDPQRPGLHRLPHRPRDRDAQHRATSSRSATTAAASATRTASSITATPITARRWRWASRTSPAMWPPATTATATTTSCRFPIRTPTCPSTTSRPPAPMPSRRHRRLHPVHPARQPARRQEIPGAARHLRADDRPAVRRVRLLRRPHPALARAARSGSTATTRRPTARPNSRSSRMTNGSPASRRSTASCTSWWSPASCCWSSPACR